jgi:hypothetical protein
MTYEWQYCPTCDLATDSAEEICSDCGGEMTAVVGTLEEYKAAILP